jgi:hypothetical protein
MAAGYLWAIVPAVLILVGAAVTGVRFLRKPSGESFVLLALPVVVALGLW